MEGEDKSGLPQTVGREDKVNKEGSLFIPPFILFRYNMSPLKFELIKTPPHHFFGVI